MSQLFTFVALSGVLANLASGPIIKLIGVLPFTVLATSSTLLFWSGFASGSQRAALVCAVVGLLGPARTLGASTTMTSEGARLGVPQGQLSAERNALNALIKVVAPTLYATLFTFGSKRGAIGLPFFVTSALLASSALLAATISYEEEKD